LYDLLTRSGILLGLGLLLAAVAGGWLARRMGVPIRELQLGAARLGAGAPGHRLRLKTRDEVGALADPFNRRVAALPDACPTPEAKVEARTHELAEALEQQTATADVLKVISGSPGELKAVFDAMLENATRICRAEFGRMALSDGSTFKTAAMFGGTPEYARFLEENPEGHAGLISQMTADRKAIHVLDAREPADYRS